MDNSSSTVQYHHGPRIPGPGPRAPDEIPLFPVMVTFQEGGGGKGQETRERDRERERERARKGETLDEVRLEKKKRRRRGERSWMDMVMVMGVDFPSGGIVWTSPRKYQQQQQQQQQQQ
ncbi:hypothetical protein BP00DRAFT_494290 [Aspergillus indologenus CBS 114.80]|uniref:Uncharacterized protein n=1 Tax=Aspergillus indologenus CBS 114.80 TaxID=1450541 RepID=A0A2V5I800_9EURO|nr:hypothetical protein BP00DRAFT_494290 [Aspergillus indologenus CBS 114.80]